MHFIQGRTGFQLLLISFTVDLICGLRLSSSYSEDNMQPQSSPNIAVVYAADPQDMEGVIHSMRSVVRNTIANVNIYLFIEHDHKASFDNLTHADRTPINKKYFSRSDVDVYMNKAYSKTATNKALDNPCNYARFIMMEQIPKADGMIWIDADTIATTDITVDMDEFMQSGKVMGAFARPSLFGVNKKSLQKIENETELEVAHSPYFNAGFFYLSPVLYREGGWAKKFERLIAANNQYKWWIKGGSQPPLNVLMGGDNFFQIQGFKFVLGLGKYKKVKTDQKALYHWNGPLKPWHDNGLHKDLWNNVSSESDEAIHVDTHAVRPSENEGNEEDCATTCRGYIDLFTDYGPCDCF